MGETQASDSNAPADPCGDFGPVQRNALVWFLCVVVGGAVLVSQFARIDSWMYTNNAENLDYGKYRENRRAQYSLGSDAVDPRSMGGLPQVEADKR